MRIDQLFEKISQLNEGGGRIILGVNTPPGITIDHTKITAKKLGFNVSRDGRPPIMPVNGTINQTPPEDSDETENDKKSLFDRKIELNKYTGGSN